MSLAQCLQGALVDQYPEAISPFLRYLTLLKKWNQHFNLTALSNDQDLVSLHIVDSLSIQPYLAGEMILDVGSGAGLPGMVLAIVNPEKRFTLLDSNGKKTRFLTQVKIELGLNNVSVISSRIETFNPPEKFSTITSRAFASLEKFYTTTQHLLAPGGLWLAMKGKRNDHELRPLQDAGKVHIQCYPLHHLQESRTLVVMRTG